MTTIRTISIAHDGVPRSEIDTRSIRGPRAMRDGGDTASIHRKGAMTPFPH